MTVNTSKRPVRVCVVRQHIFPYQRNLRRNCETLARKGYEVDMICQRGKGQKSRESFNGINIYRLPVMHHRGKVLQYLFDYTTFFLMVFFTLSWLMPRRRYRVVEVETMPDFLVFATLVPRLLGARIILYMFEDIPLLFASTFRLGAGHPVVRLLRLVSRLSATYAHQVIVSDGIHHKRAVERLGIPGDKITLVYNVPDESVFFAGAASSLHNGVFRMMVLSSLLPRYGVDTAIRAVARLVPEIPDLELCVVGEGESRPGLEQLARDLGVEKHVNFTGWKLQEEVAGYIARADIAVAPMLDDVGLPNKMFDYFALGRPCVVSNLPSLTAAFDGDHVAFFKAGDDAELARRVLELYKSPQKRAALGAQGKAFYEARRWPVMKKTYLSVYARCLNLPEDGAATDARLTPQS